MLQLRLSRYLKSNRFTLGVLDFDGGVCDTLELPDIGNLHDVSCIPVGTYNLNTYTRPSGFRVIRVLNVPGRDNIEIHEGNYLEQTDGCILVGGAIRYRGLMPYLLNSEMSFDRIYNQVLNDQHPMLVVMDSIHLDDARTADVKAVTPAVQTDLPLNSEAK